MRAWLYDTLVDDPALQAHLGGPVDIRERVLPRRTRENILVAKPFLVYGLGNATREELDDPTANDARAERQFFQVWVHDEGGSYVLIDDLVEIVKRRLTGQSHKASKIITITFLETSGEFNNETYNTLFRYIRFQAIIARGRIAS